MTAAPSTTAEPARSPSTGSAVLALGFATTVAMWAVGFVSRLPAVAAPPWIVLGLLLACFLGGAFLAGRHASGGWRAGLGLGLLVAVLNLLVLGSLLAGDSPNAVRPGAIVWLPGFFAAMVILGAVAAAPAARLAPAESRGSWSTVFAHVAAAATFFLLLVGGLVTSHEAGLAVTDWPNSFGYNMFLYPLSRMTGGIYYEHSHRLFGSLVGLTTLVLAIQLHIVDRRRWVRRLSLAAVVLVVVQGLLGGLRVTGRLTFSTSAADMAPSLPLALVHGVLGQIVFGLLVALAVFTRDAWREGRGAAVTGSAGADRALAAVVPFAVLIQLGLGALLRHFSRGLLPHITMAALVVAVAVAAGALAVARGGVNPVLGRLGRVLVAVVLLQVTLGISVLIPLTMRQEGTPPGAAEVALATAHQATGAVLLAVSVMLALWTFRLRLPGVRSPVPEGGPPA